MEEGVRIKLARRIKQRRRQVGMTQEELSAKTGLDYKYVQRIEGKNPPAIRVDTIAKIAKALNTTPSKLFQFDA